MKRSLLTVFLTLFSAAAFSQLTNKTINVGAVSRTYKQYLPVGFDPQNEQVSVVIALHGLGGNSSQMVSTGLNFIADTARIIAIYPQGLNNGFGQASWNNGAGFSSTADDLGFINQLIDSAVLNYNADPSRVYVCGFSMGSIMSYHLACTMNSRIAAIGCMSGTMADSDIATCTPTYVTPVIHFHGTVDATIPYEGSGLPTLSVVSETMTFWKNAHSCASTADSLRITDVASDGITIDRFRYDACSQLSALELWRLNGADHVYLYKPTNDIDEMIEAWLFMSRWSHNNPAAAGLNENSFTQLIVAPNPAKDRVEVESNVAANYTLVDLQGNLVQQGNLIAGKNELSVSGLKSGVYFLQTAGGRAKISVL